MGDLTAQCRPGQRLGDTRDLSPAAIGEILGSLVGSTEPAVVFSSLVRLVVPMICDVATATVSGSDGLVCAVSWPRDAVLPTRRTSVEVRFEAPGDDCYEPFHGQVTLGFAAGDSHQPYVAQLLVDGAMARVERERLLDSMTPARTQAAHLEVALSTNREISVAVGILTVVHTLTTAEALDLLRRVSQHTNRKLRDLALEVVDTRALVVPPGLEVTTSGARSVPLHSLSLTGRR